MPKPDVVKTNESVEDRLSLNDLYMRYRVPLIRYFIRRRLALDLAEDCAHDVFVRLTHVNLSTIENPDAYIFAVASTVTIDHIRRNSARCSSLHDSIQNIEIESLDASPSYVFENKDALMRLDRILDELPPLTREIFMLKRLDGLSYTQLAVRFGISVTAVEKRISRALAHLRSRFSPDD